MWSMVSEEPRAGRMRGLRQISARGLTYRAMCIPWMYRNMQKVMYSDWRRPPGYCAIEAFEEEAGRYPCEPANASDTNQDNRRQVVVAVAHHMEDNAETVLFSDASRKRSKGIRHASGFCEEWCHLYQAAFISDTRTDRGISKGKRTGFLSPMPQTLTQPTPEISCAMMCFHCFCRLMTGRLSISMRAQDSLR